MEKKLVVHIAATTIIIIGIGFAVHFLGFQYESSDISSTNTDQKATSRSTELPRESDRSQFDIKDGKLIRFKGRFNREREIILPSDVRVIGKEAFKLGKEDRESKVSLLRPIHLSIPPEVTLEMRAFSLMGPMKIVFEEGRKEIEAAAFCDSIQTAVVSEVVIPDSVTVIGNSCFLGSDSNFLKVRLGNGIRIIEDFALTDMRLESIPPKVKKIGKGAFGSFGDQGKMPGELPEGVESLGASFVTLYDGKIRIPASVKEIALNAVEWDSSAKDRGYIVDPDNPYYKSDEKGWLYSKSGESLYYAYLPDMPYKITGKIKKVYRAGVHTGWWDEERPHPRIYFPEGAEIIE